jgi:Carboxypeptidase regulatory-like domain
MTDDATAAAHMTRDELLEQLTRLLPAQFDEVLFRARLPAEHLSASSAPQATRAIEVIRALEPQGRLPEIARAIEYVTTRQHAGTTSPEAATAAHPRARSQQEARRSRALAPLVVAAATGAATLALLVLMLSSGPMLVRDGLAGHAWYVLPLLLGLFAAVTVFSLFKSYARYRCKVLRRMLEFGGPVVVMLVVIVLGFRLVPAPLPAPPQRFGLTVFLHGKAGRQAVVLRNHGKVSLDLGADKRIEAVGDKGEARFTGIPGDLRDREVAIGLDDETYELVDPELTIRLGQEAVYAAVQPRQLPLIGYVSDDQGRPLPQARAAIATATAVTDQDGRFEIQLPADLPEGERSITITAAGYEPWRAQAVPGSNPLNVRLSPSPERK